MKPIHLLFEPQGSRSSFTTFGKPATSARRAALPITAMLTVAIAAFCAVALLASDINQRVSIARSTLHAAQEGRVHGATGSVARPARSAPGTSQREDWERLARLLETPWPALLDVLETSLNDSVAIVEVAPDAQRLSMQVQSEARTLESLLGYADRLKATGAFDDVVLVRHETNERDPAHPVRMRLTLRLKRTALSPPASLAGRR